MKQFFFFTLFKIKLFSHSLQTEFVCYFLPFIELEDFMKYKNDEGTDENGKIDINSFIQKSFSADI